MISMVCLGIVLYILVGVFIDGMFGLEKGTRILSVMWVFTVPVFLLILVLLAFGDLCKQIRKFGGRLGDRLNQ